MQFLVLIYFGIDEYRQHNTDLVSSNKPLRQTVYLLPYFLGQRDQRTPQMIDFDIRHDVPLCREQIAARLLERLLEDLRLCAMPSLHNGESNQRGVRVGQPPTRQDVSQLSLLFPPFEALLDSLKLLFKRPPHPMCACDEVIVQHGAE